VQERRQEDLEGRNPFRNMGHHPGTLQLAVASLVCLYVSSRSGVKQSPPSPQNVNFGCNLILTSTNRGCVSGESIKHLQDAIEQDGSYDYDMIDGWEDLE
jgi:hypothetical protein